MMNAKTPKYVLQVGYLYLCLICILMLMLRLLDNSVPLTIICLYPQNPKLIGQISQLLPVLCKHILGTDDLWRVHLCVFSYKGFFFFLSLGHYIYTFFDFSTSLLSHQIHLHFLFDKLKRRYFNLNSKPQEF